MKEFGEGLDRICREQEANGAKTPSFRTDEFILKITVPKVTEKVAEKVTVNDEKVAENQRGEAEKVAENHNRLTEKLIEKLIEKASTLGEKMRTTNSILPHRPDI